MGFRFRARKVFGWGLGLIGFGVLGGIGMGLGYAAATPAAVRWFGPQRRGLIVGHEQNGSMTP